MSKEETNRVHYTGSSPIEIRVGNFQQSFLPDEVAEIVEPRFRIDLLSREDFKLSQLDVRAGEKPAKTKKAKAKGKKAAPKPAVTEPVESTDSETETETKDAEGGVNDNE